MMNLILASEIIAVGYIFKKVVQAKKTMCGSLLLSLSQGHNFLLFVLSVRTVQSART